MRAEKSTLRYCPLRMMQQPVLFYFFKIYTSSLIGQFLYSHTRLLVIVRPEQYVRWCTAKASKSSLSFWEEQLIMSVVFFLSQAFLQNISNNYSLCTEEARKIISGLDKNSSTFFYDIRWYDIAEITLINNIVCIIALIIYFIKSLYASNALQRIVTIKRLQKIIMLLIIL